MAKKNNEKKISELAAMAGAPDSNDRVPIVDVSDTSMAASGTTKYTTAGNLTGAGGSDADAIHDNVSGEIRLITEKTVPANGDLFIIEDSAASDAKKRMTWANIIGNAGITNLSDVTTGSEANNDFLIFDGSVWRNRVPLLARIALGNIEENADVTDAANVAAAGAVMQDASEDADGIEFLERADHPNTPAATKGQLWVRNDAPNVLVFTDDAGTDTVLGAGGGGLDNVVEDTTPQLGGALDVNGNEIQSVGGADVDVHSDNNIILELGDAAGADKVSIRDSAGTEQAAVDSDGNITTNGTVDGRDIAADGANLDTALQSDASIDADGVQFLERADHPNTPAATKGQLWVSNDATQELKFTDDAGTDNDVAFLARAQTLTNKTIDGDNNTLSNLDIGNEVDWALIGDVTDRGAFASGDKLLIFEAGVGMRKIDFDDLPGAGGGLSNIVEDTTPQLGGDLDCNGFDIQFDDLTGIRDDSDNEQLIFDKVLSAVNYLTITNAATTNAPQLNAAGSDANISLNITAKGTGVVQVDGVEAADISSAQTLTNKTIDGASNTLQNIPMAEASGTLTVPNGGTGVTSLTDGGVLLGSGTGAITAMSVLADGEMIVGDGTTDPVAESGATLRTSIGVGSGDSPTFDGCFMNEKAAADGDVAGDGQWWVQTAAPNRPMFTDDTGQDFELLHASMTIAASDETTDLTTGAAKATFRMPFDMTLTEVRASVTTAPTGSVLTVDINESGTTILSTKLTIDATEETSETAATPPVISDSALGDDNEITIDIDTVGSTVAGTGLKVTLIGYRT